MKYYIYKITNYANGKVYIGLTNRISPKGFLWRWKEHLKLLKANKHKNKDMQCDFNLNPDEFDWEILEEIETDKLPVQKEKEWMMRHKSHIRKYGYNHKDTIFGKKEGDLDA